MLLLPVFRHTPADPRVVAGPVSVALSGKRTANVVTAQSEAEHSGEPGHM